MPLSALLILALSLAPGANAETSAEKVYELGPENAVNEPAPKPKPTDPRETTTRPSKPNHAAQPAGAPEARDEKPDASTGPQGEAPPKKNDGHRPAGHQDPKGKGTKKNVAVRGETPSPVTGYAPKKTGGSSSPVVALLIAVSVLAVISIGVARYRLRR